MSLVQPHIPVAAAQPGHPWPVVRASRRDVKSPLARFAHRHSPILAKAFAKHIPVLCPSGQPPAVQNRSRRFCRGELTDQWRKDNPELISGDNSAEALLERVKAERAEAKANKRKAPV